MSGCGLDGRGHRVGFVGGKEASPDGQARYLGSHVTEVVGSGFNVDQSKFEAMLRVGDHDG
ncbi:MAG: hypothetical protein ISQ09_05460 [Rubripirellula sp.]|jgi:uncharacterized protein YueI|nr:hypothetical protein [Rubripirellula sp.]